MDEKILFVDDEENILHAYKLALHKQYQLTTATSAATALEMIESDGPFAVIVSDMKMPGMDGIEFLRIASERAPDTVRVMLTGFAELQTAVEAVNSGNIFRFLTKPCPAEEIAVTLESCLAQYRLVTSEKVLLEDTLNGSIKVLTEILSLVNPATFGRAQRIKEISQHIAVKLRLQEMWQFEIAAMLSQIGCITLSQSTLEKIYAGRELDDDEKTMLEKQPEVGRHLIEHIPRLESVAKMVENQSKRYVDYGDPIPIEKMSTEDLGAQILRVAIDFDRHATGGSTTEMAIQALQMHRKNYNMDLVKTLTDMDDGFSEMSIKQILVRDLKLDMVVNEDVKACNGLLLVIKGQVVTRPVMERLRQYSEGSVGVEEPICVMVHKYAEENQPVSV